MCGNCHTEVGHGDHEGKTLFCIWWRVYSDGTFSKKSDNKPNIEGHSMEKKLIKPVIDSRHIRVLSDKTRKCVKYVSGKIKEPSNSVKQNTLFYHKESEMVATKDPISKFNSISNMPMDTLSILELSQVYAYNLLTHGDNHTRTNIVIEEIEHRDKECSGLRSKNNQLEQELEKWILDCAEGID